MFAVGLFVGNPVGSREVGIIQGPCNKWGSLVLAPAQAWRQQTTQKCAVCAWRLSSETQIGSCELLEEVFEDEDADDGCRRDEWSAGEDKGKVRTERARSFEEALLRLSQEREQRRRITCKDHCSGHRTPANKGRLTVG